MILVALLGIAARHFLAKPEVLPWYYMLINVSFGLGMTGYFIVCHGVWGRTLGKLIVGTRVVTLDGGHISWNQALLRNCVEIGFMILNWIVFIPIYWTAPIDGFSDLSMTERRHLFDFLAPVWYTFGVRKILSSSWGVADTLSIFINKKRRAIHDLIAGTVVVQDKPSRKRINDDPYYVDPEKEMRRINRMIRKSKL